MFLRFLFIPIFAIMVLTGCATSTFNYSPPLETKIQNTKQVDLPFDTVWDQLVKQLSTDFFVINNIDKNSRLMLNDLRIMLIAVIHPVHLRMCVEIKFTHIKQQIHLISQPQMMLVMHLTSTVLRSLKVEPISMSPQREREHCLRLIRNILLR